MVVFQKLEGKTTTLKFWNKKLEGKTTTLMFWNQKLEGKTTTPKNCVLTNFLHERSRIFFPVFSLVRFWILLRNAYYMHILTLTVESLHHWCQFFFMMVRKCTKVLGGEFLNNALCTLAKAKIKVFIIFLNKKETTTLSYM